MAGGGACNFKKLLYTPLLIFELTRFLDASPFGAKTDLFEPVSWVLVLLYIECCNAILKVIN